MLYTDVGVRVDHRIKDGRTEFFANQEAAKAHARVTRSYPYQVFDKDNKHAGYGVPK